MDILILEIVKISDRKDILKNNDYEYSKNENIKPSKLIFTFILYFFSRLI